MNQQDTIDRIADILRKIDRRDYESPKITFVPDEIGDDGTHFGTYENNFVSKFNEIFYQFEHNGEIINRRELQRQLQIPKKYIYSEHNDPIVERFYNKLQKRYGQEVEGKIEFETIPDFFIHKDQNDQSPENQQLIMEFKTEFNIPVKRFMWDFFKLNLYLEKYNYQLACFVCINNSKRKVEELLLRYVNEDHYQTSKKDRLFIIIRESYLAEIQYFSFSQFITDKGG